MRRLQREYAAGQIAVSELTQRIASWLGHARHADTYRLRERLFGEMRFCKSGNTARRSAAANNGTGVLEDLDSGG